MLLGLVSFCSLWTRESNAFAAQEKWQGSEIHLQFRTASLQSHPALQSCNHKLSVNFVQWSLVDYLRVPTTFTDPIRRHHMYVIKIFQIYFIELYLQSWKKFQDCIISYKIFSNQNFTYLYALHKMWVMDISLRKYKNQGTNGKLIPWYGYVAWRLIKDKRKDETHRPPTCWVVGTPKGTSHWWVYCNVDP